MRPAYHKANADRHRDDALVERNEPRIIWERRGMVWYWVEVHEFRVKPRKFASPKAEAEA